jgi:Tripartite tricarboxylate transporter family receptor
MLPCVQRGELRGLAVTSPKRSALVPDLPTLREIDLAAAEIEDGSSCWARRACPTPSSSA